MPKQQVAEALEWRRSAYLIFDSEERVLILEEFPGITEHDIMKLQVERWNELPPEHVVVYETEAQHYVFQGLSPGGRWQPEDKEGFGMGCETMSQTQEYNRKLREDARKNLQVCECVSM
jgi:hypothetical protein